MKGKFGFGSVWTWTAIDADTKLMVSWLVGERSLPYAVKFMDDVAARLAHCVQLTTDGHRPYLQAVEGAFGSEVDYAILEKIYAAPLPNKARQLDTVPLSAVERALIRSQATQTVSMYRPAMQSA